MLNPWGWKPSGNRNSQGFFAPAFCLYATNIHTKATWGSKVTSLYFFRLLLLELWALQLFSPSHRKWFFGLPLSIDWALAFWEKKGKLKTQMSFFVGVKEHKEKSLSYFCSARLRCYSTHERKFKRSKVTLSTILAQWPLLHLHAFKLNKASDGFFV